LIKIKLNIVALRQIRKMDTDNRINFIIKASWIAIIGNAILAIAKINIGIFAGSLAVIGDGIDSGSDIATSLITLFIARILTKPPSIKYPYGYRRADTIAAKALSFVILFAGLQLAISTVGRLISGTETTMPDKVAIYVTILSIIGKLFLASFLIKTGKRTKSMMLIANGKNMSNDVIMSATVLFGLFFTFVTKMPVIDSITALFVSIWIIKTGVQIFMESNMELMDGQNDETIYKKVCDAVLEIEGANNPHRMRVRRIADKINVTLDIEVDGDISVNKAHLIAHMVEKNIKNKIDGVYDVLIHIEPIGVEHEVEKFGISYKDF